MDIPVIYQYYPSVPLSDLSDLYSPGTFTLANKKICIISFLSKTLRINPDFPFKNTYILFLEDVAKVDSIDWTFQLYKRGETVTDPAFMRVKGDHSNRCSIEFRGNIFDGAGALMYDRLRVSCKVKKGPEEKTLYVEHSLVKMLDVREVGLFTNNQTLLSGDPATTNYMINHLTDYLPKGTIMWNGKEVHTDLLGERTLAKIVMGIIYEVLMTSEDHLFDPPLFYDLSKHYNYGVENFINNAAIKEYDGDLTAGIARIPMHILNDVIGADNEVPDFNNINASNEVYSMIVYDQALTVNTIEDEFLMTIPQKLAKSKERLAVNKIRTRKLYHFAQFPKSAITLTSLIIKYLFECSRKNECRDFQFKFVTWPYLGLDNLKEKANQDFLRYTLTHYFNGPANLVDDFAERAVKVSTLVWSPTIHTVVNVQPRIVQAYFAKKVVKRIDVVKNASGAISSSEFIFDFERIDNSATRVNDTGAPLPADQQPDFDTVLGREIFVVVETLGCRGSDIVMNVKPADNVMTGNTNKLRLWNGVEHEFMEDFVATVGDFSALKRTDNGKFVGSTVKTEQYLPIDHKDKAIFKISLRPQSNVTIEAWQQGSGAVTGLRDNKGNLAIEVKLSNDAHVYFGNNLKTTSTAGEFLNANDKYLSTARIRVANYMACEIYHRDNPYKITSSEGVMIETIGKIDNAYIRSIPNTAADRVRKKFTYYFHDALGNEHNICTTIILSTTAKTRGVWNAATVVTGAALDPAEINFLTQRHAGENIDAIRMRFYVNGTYVEGRAGNAAAYLNDTPDAWRWYISDAATQKELVRADILQNTYVGPNAVTAMNYERGGVRIKFNFQHTRRRWANPDVFGAVLGALAMLYEKYPALTMVTAGFAFEDGSCYPSKEHVNGEAMDSNYFGNHAQNQYFIDLLFHYGFRLFRVGHGMVYNHATADPAPPPGDDSLHSDHLHTTDLEDEAPIII